MSHYNNIETQIKSVPALVQALCRVPTRTGQWSKAQIEVHDKPQSLYGYKNDAREQTAEVIIRREHVGGAANDIGFKKQSDGTYTAIISDYDRKYYTDSWLNKVGTYYGVERTKMSCLSRGIHFTETIDDKQRPVIRCHVPG